MADKTAVTQEDLEAHLEAQVGFLKRSSQSFDDGFEDEAKRLATAIRVLVHDTRHPSLLTQLNRKDGEFLDTAMDLPEDNQLSEYSLLNASIGQDREGNNNTAFFAPLDSAMSKNWTSFELWWDMPIFKDSNGTRLRRCDVVLTMANQDGGAHVDPKLNTAYADLTKNHSLGLVAVAGDKEWLLEGVANYAVRQIAHELLKSIDPNFSQEQKIDTGIIVGGMYFGKAIEPTQETKMKAKMGVEANQLPKVGVNKMCPCGSGKKYKKCHGPFRSFVG